MDSELDEAIGVFEMQRGAKIYPGERLILEAARKVANGIPTPFCSTHNRTVPSPGVTFTGHGGHHSPTEGCRIIQAVIVEVPDGH